MQEVPKNKMIVVKHNDLIDAAQKLSIYESRIILTCISLIDSKSSLDFSEKFVITVEDIVDLVDVSDTSVYNLLKEAVERLSERWVVFMKPSQRVQETRVRWVYKISYIPTQGTIELSFSPDIIKLLTEISRDFTQYKLENVLKFRGFYSVRLYELMCRWGGKNKTIELEWLKENLQLEDHGLPGLFRTQKGWGPLRTRMQTTPGPHEGLGLDYYAWCTSPLRRYSDLVNQWQLLALAQHGVTAKMVAPFPPRDASLMGIAADFESCYQAYGEYQDRLEKYWCLRWIAQEGGSRTVNVRHLKEGMSRVELVPLHITIPELATHPRMTRAQVVIADVDLLQLAASVRVLEIESLVKIAEELAENPAEDESPE